MKTYVNPVRFKYIKKIRGLTNKEIANKLNMAKTTVDDITRNKSFDTVYLKEICRLLNVSIDYLTDRYNEKPTPHSLDAVNMKLRDFLQKYPQSTAEIYYLLRSDCENRVDPEGYLIPSYESDRLKQMADSNYDAFLGWLHTLNRIEDIGIIQKLPTDSELDYILATMTKNDVLRFQSSLVDNAINYLIANGYYTFNKLDISDDFDRYLKRVEERKNKFEKEGSKQDG